MKYLLTVLVLLVGSTIPASFQSDGDDKELMNNLTTKIDNLKDSHIDFFKKISEFQDDFLDLSDEHEKIFDEFKHIQIVLEEQYNKASDDALILFIAAVILQIIAVVTVLMYEKAKERKKTSSTLDELEYTSELTVKTFGTILSIIELVKNNPIQKYTESALIHHKIHLQTLVRKLEMYDQLLPRSTNLSIKINYLNRSILVAIDGSNCPSAGDIIKESDIDTFKSNYKQIESNFKNLQTEINIYKKKNKMTVK